MKKFFSIIALSAMTLSLSSFDSQQDQDLVVRNCSMEAIAIYDFHMAFSNVSEAEAFASADAHYNNCIADGGSPGGPIHNQ